MENKFKIKYMTFNSSCAFAGVANMLAQYGINVEDRDIAIGMGLPYLFEKDSDTYLAGPMLQSSHWFNRYLHSIGYTMQEESVVKEIVPDHLRDKKCAMLGLHVSPESKHAVIYTGKESEDSYSFLNNKWQQSEEPEQFSLSRQELLERLDDTVMIATIIPLRNCTLTQEAVEKSPPSSKTYDSNEALYHRSCAVLEEWKQNIQTFCEVEQSPASIRFAMNTLFRAVLLDAVTMLELAENHALADALRGIQREFLLAARISKPMILAKEISMSELLDAVDQYIDWIRAAI